MQNIERFDRNMAVLAEAFDKTLSQLLLTLYQRVLSKFDDDEIERAMMTAVATLKWFPKPAELLEIIRGRMDQRAVLAWDSILTAMQRCGSGDSVLFEDGRTAKTIELMGGWINLNLMTLEEEKWRRAEFIKLYQALPEMGPILLHGRFATDNSARGFLDHVPEPVRIEAPLGVIENGNRVAGYLM